MSICEKKFRHKYGLFMQSKYFYRISSFYKKELTQLKAKQLKKNIFKSMGI